MSARGPKDPRISVASADAMVEHGLRLGDAVEADQRRLAAGGVLGGGLAGVLGEGRWRR